MRILAIGDIHGCRASLEALAEQVDFSAADTVITLGDYVDRGSDSRGVIEFLLRLKVASNLIALRGNHEIMMLQARKFGSALLGWAGVGGEATLDSYGAHSFDDIPRNHWKFLEQLSAFYEIDSHFFVHANADPDLDLRDQPDDLLYWESIDNPPPHKSGKIMVCGHTPQKSGRPLNISHAVCIDTWAHGGGWLTCLDVLSGHYWQANEKGKCRSNVLGADLNESQT